MGTMFHVRYSGVAKGPGYESWREDFARKWLDSHFDPIGSDRLVSDIKASRHAFASICTARGTPVHIELSPAPSPYLYIVMASGSQARVFQRGKLHDVPLGHMALMSAEEPASGAQLTEGSRMSLRDRKSVV